MTRYHLLLLWLAVILLAGCKKDPQEIFSEQKSGVVLICNEYYYDITLSDGDHIYFSGLDSNGSFVNLTGNLATIKQHPGVLNGTGFFIDKAGRILTNRHVVAPEVDKSTVKNNVNRIIESFTLSIQALQDSLNQRYQSIELYASQNSYQNEYGETVSQLSGDELSSLQEEVEHLKEQYDEAESVKNSLRSNILSDHFTIQLHSQFGVAFDGSDVDSWNDFMKTPCSLLRVSEDANSDLALLQLKTAMTPPDHFVFDIAGANANYDDKLQINQTVFMIGYNHGVALAKTDNGIRAQFTSGTITQQPDGKRITYSIPAMPGSSGSPVVDERGKLIAVNFAGSNGSDNFNFGIPLMRVLTFVR